MAKGISIGVASDTREFAQGVKTGVVKPLEDASDALDDVAKDGEKAGEKLERAFKDAQGEVSDFKKEQSELGKAMQRTSKEGGTALSRNVKEGTDKAGESAKELGGELRQNVGETFASFKGDVSDFGQIAQDTLGGLAGSGALGGIPGLAATAAGAAGIGLIIGALTSAGEQSEQFKADVGELAQQLIDAGNTGELSIDQIVSKLEELATTGDSADVTLSKLSKASKTTGTSFKDVAQAYAGNTDKLKALLAVGKEHLRQLEDGRHTAKDAYGWNLGVTKSVADETAAQKELNKYLDQASTKASAAAKETKLYAESGAPALKVQAAAVDAYADSVQSALQDAGAAWEDYNKDGTKSLAEYNAHIEEQIKAVQGYQANMVTASHSLSQEALNYIESLGQDAAPILQAYVDAPLKEQQRTAANWATLGKSAGDAYTAKLKAGIPSSIPGPRIVATVDTAAAKRKLHELANGYYRTTFEVAGVTRQGRRIL